MNRDSRRQSPLGIINQGKTGNEKLRNMDTPFLEKLRFPSQDVSKQRLTTNNDFAGRRTGQIDLRVMSCNFCWTFIEITLIAETVFASHWSEESSVALILLFRTGNFSFAVTRHVDAIVIRMLLYPKCIIKAFSARRKWLMSRANSVSVHQKFLFASSFCGYNLDGRIQKSFIPLSFSGKCQLEQSY